MPLRPQPVKHQAKRYEGYEDLNTISLPRLCHRRREWNRRTNVGTSAQSTRTLQRDNESAERIAASPFRPRHLSGRIGTPLNLSTMPTMALRLHLHLHVLTVLVRRIRIA